jgi:hypothetical protein
MSVGSSMTAKDVSRCPSALTCERICLTSQPRTTSASAINDRWAAPRDSLGAHNRRPRVRAIGHKLFKCSLKCVRLHIVGVAAKTGVAPPVVHRILPSLSKAPKRPHVERAEVGFLQALSQRVHIELWIVS